METVRKIKIFLFLLLLFSLPSLFPDTTEIYLYPHLGEVRQKISGKIDSLDIPTKIIPSSLILIVDGKEEKEFSLEGIYPEMKRVTGNISGRIITDVVREMRVPSYYPSRGKWRIKWKGKSRASVKVRYFTRSLSYQATSRLDLATGEFTSGVYLMNSLLSFKNCKVKMVVGEVRKRERYPTPIGVYPPLDISSFYYKEEINLGRRALDTGRTFVKLFEGKVSLRKRFLWKAWESPEVKWEISFPNPANFTLPPQQIWLKEKGFYKSIAQIGPVSPRERVELSLDKAPLKVDKELKIERMERGYLHRVSLTILNQSGEKVEGEVVERRKADVKEWESSLLPDWEKGGEVGWRITLSPGEEKKILYRFLLGYAFTRKYERRIY